MLFEPNLPTTSISSRTLGVSLSYTILIPLRLENPYILARWVSADEVKTCYKFRIAENRRLP